MRCSSKSPPNQSTIIIGEDIDEAGDPPRIWSKYEEYPGTAFTRSLGDSIAEELGVYAGACVIA